ncbi:PREDICTED: uncharacterized protein LOC108371094 [Rhagoletis zephyria]|uniref:uncharacterized protein LOC108371094 n=1 Tax=Rhagoletis zephyria TaxID=28612 RepID=UPI000811AA73|nr:PREDICTED: uncharacterized protein LOC108371094 [Rhagoletis zephyria]
MTVTTAIVIAGLFQIVLRTSFFFEQEKGLCSPAPSLASWIFLISLLDLISDLCLYPVRYMHLPYLCQVIVETIITILLTEFGAIVVWCTLEKLIWRLIKSILLVMGMSTMTYANYETLILGVTTTSISLVILAFVGQATDHFHMIRKKCQRIERKVALNIEMLWHYVNGCGTPPRRCKGMHECMSDDFEDICCPKRRRRRRRC